MIEDASVSILARWKDFYVIVGSSAGALTGLQFVTMTLISESRINDKRAVQAFGSPTVVHFCMALLVSALGSCPWDGLLPLAVAIGCCGIGGVVYALWQYVTHANRTAINRTGKTGCGMAGCRWWFMEDWRWRDL